jgi:hypothetical protein
MFQSVADRDVFGFSTSPDGSNLPDTLRPWQRCGSQAVPIADSQTGSGDSALMRHLKAEGFYVTRSAAPTTKPATLLPFGGHLGGGDRVAKRRDVERTHPALPSPPRLDSIPSRGDVLSTDCRAQVIFPVSVLPL